ncbi:MAG: transporter substrate-binding domain-containing protein [Pseudonocardiales bacterium]
MPEGQLQHPWPDPPPGPKGPRGTRAWTALRALHAGGWLRPRRIGCLLVVLAILLYAALWSLSSAVNGVTAMFRPDPVPGSPFDTVTPTSPTSTGPPGPDLVLGGKLIVAVQNVPGLAEPTATPGGYTGFGIALVELIASELGEDHGATNYKSASTTSAAIGMFARGEANLALGEFAITPQPITPQPITPQQSPELGIVVPYLESPLRLAVPSNSPVNGLDSLGQGKVCAPRDSPAEAALESRLGDRLTTRANLGACDNLLGVSVTAIIGDDLALRRLPAMTSGQLRVVGEPLGTTEYGIAVQPDDHALRDRVIYVLRTAIADGTWARLYTESFNKPAPDPPTIR